MIQKTLLRREVRREILKMILEGTLRPGDRINESELSRMMGVSRTPLREALMRLENEQIVTSEPAKGFSIRPLTEKEISEKLPIFAELEIIALRNSEPITPERAQKLREINAQFTNRDLSDHDLSEVDMEWHAELIAGCPNDFLKSLIKEIRQQIRQYDLIYMEAAEQGAVSAKEHEEMIVALEKGDIDGAVEISRKNNLESLDPIITRLREMEKEPNSK